MVIPMVMWLTGLGSDTLRTPTDTIPVDSATVRAAGAVLAPVTVGPADHRQPGRRRAVEYSDWYGRRVTIHRWASYAMVPLFATEYWLGNKLLNDAQVSSSTRDTHAAVASGIGVLFAANTVTGLWNLWDARRDPAGRGKRIVHSALLLAADAGFLYTASLAEDDDGEGDHRDGGVNGNIRHRNAALISIGLGTAGTALMWFFKD